MRSTKKFAVSRSSNVSTAAGQASIALQLRTLSPLKSVAALERLALLAAHSTRQFPILLCLTILSTGCAVTPTYRAHPGFSERFGQLKDVSILPAKIDVFYLEAGGLPEKREEWSEQARGNILSAIQAELETKTGHRIHIKSQDRAALEARGSLESTYALFRVVSQSIMLHTYAPDPNYQFAEKIANFDYSLGAEVKDLASDDSDALLLVIGRDHVWSEGRKALQALGVILGIGAGVATGVVVIPRLGGGTVLQAALVDAHSGDLLWYNMTASGSGADLRDSGSAAEWVKYLFKDFPPTRKSE